ncbi:hypothetical protein [Aestuariibacter salexigens]|uniref:hypothetical protein n=1 Tax=Aestuariibacter salexigens TaxID=226010 RepID=UPI0004141E3D|nr:hypothetical protein [Aestuariibacter salexigens]
MYRLVEHADVDFTVNVKDTRALAPQVEFIEPPLKQLVINLYRAGGKDSFTSIAAIRNFDYNGSRQELVGEHYKFIDLPTAESALQFFLKGRSDALISYQSNVKHLQKYNALMFADNVTITPIRRVNAYFGIAKGSEHFELLKQVFTDYAEQNDLKYFVQVMAEAE